MSENHRQLDSSFKPPRVPQLKPKVPTDEQRSNKVSKVQRFHFQLERLSAPPPLPVSRSALTHFLEVAQLRKTPRIPELLREEAELQLLRSQLHTQRETDEEEEQ